MPDAVVAGHICLDIIPDLSRLTPGAFDAGFQPGRLVQAGPAAITTGGSVSNTGLALHRLGVDTRLIARLGADELGKTVLESLSRHSPQLVEGMISSPQSSTSYSIVISPPGSDRRFIHHPGANNDFCAEDVKSESLADARLFHFGYPPLMSTLFNREGQQLAQLFQRVKSLGLTTSLDMAYPDPESPAGQADWRAILRNTLPFVDIFLPSLDEILFLLWRKTGLPPSPALLEDVSAELLALGARLVVLKLGDRGLYLRVSAEPALQGLGRACPADLAAWAGFEAWLPCFEVEVVGTTGAGDATIAGFLAALLRGLPPQQALQAALAVGACNVEAADAFSGLRSWEATLERIQAGWRQRPEVFQFSRRR